MRSKTPALTFNLNHWFLLSLLLALAACGGESTAPEATAVPETTVPPTSTSSPPPSVTPPPAATEVVATVEPTVEPTEAPITLMTDLVAWYAFDGSAEDQSPNSNDGTVSGATPINDRFGNPDSAYRLDGQDDFIVVPHDDSYALRSFTTLSAWFYYEPQAEDRTFYTIFEKTDPDRGGHSRWGFWTLGNQAEFCIQPNNGDFHYCEDTLSGLKENSWNHIVGTWDFERIAIYLNGELEVEQDLPKAGISSTNHELYFGTDPHAEPPVFIKGAIDDVRIYKRALSPDEVIELYILESEGMLTEAPEVEPHTPVLVSETVTISSVDDLEIVATFSTDAASPAQQPGVLLLHMLNSRRDAWDPLVPALQEAGYAVLAVDMRGHGETGGSQDWEMADLDMDVLLSWLGNQPGVDETRLATIGGSIGANMALRAASDWQPDDPEREVGAVVMLSGGLDYRGVTTADALAEVGERPVLIVAAEGDSYAANSARALYEQAPDGNQLIIYDGSAHGTRLLEAEPEMIPAIIEFLGETIDK